MSYKIKDRMPVSEVVLNGDFPVYFQYHCKPQNASKTPVVILMNLFQEYHHYNSEVEYLCRDFPVYLVALPGFADNKHSGENLTHVDLAKLLNQFLVNVGVDKYMLKAFSMTAQIGVWSASLYPTQVKKLMIGGTTHHMRDANKHLLTSLLYSIEQNESQLGNRLVANLFNFHLRQETAEGVVTKKILARQINRATGPQKKKVNSLINRLLTDTYPQKGIEVDTLVLSAEHDLFMTPYEGYMVMCWCRQAQLGIMKGKDHLCFLTDDKVQTKVTSRFFKENALNRLKEFSLYGRKTYPGANRRVSPRFSLGDEKTTLEVSGDTFEVEILDINGQGVHFKLAEAGQHIEIGMNDAKLSFNDLALEKELVFFRIQNEHQVVALFNHKNITDLTKLTTHLEKNGQLLT